MRTSDDEATILFNTALIEMKDMLGAMLHDGASNAILIREMRRMAAWISLKAQPASLQGRSSLLTGSGR